MQLSFKTGYSSLAIKILHNTKWYNWHHVVLWNLIIIGLNDGMLLLQWQAITWTNDYSLSAGNFSETIIEISTRK